MAKQVLTLRIDEATLGWLDGEAKRAGVSRTAVVQECVRQAVAGAFGAPDREPVSVGRRQGQLCSKCDRGIISRKGQCSFCLERV